MRVVSIAPADWLARLLGICCGPTVVPLPLAAVAAAASPGRVWPEVLLFLLFVGGAPAAVVAVAWLRGSVSDLDVTIHSQRAPLVAAGTVSCTLGAALFAVSGAEPLFVALTALAASQAALLALLTRREKVSYHAGGISTLAVACWLLASPATALTVSAIALATAWSRCHLGRHTPRQVLLGLSTGLIALAWLPNAT